MDNPSKKIASGDKTLETINARMDNFSTAIKNQHSFNKMIESQISQLITVVPAANQGKISGQLEELEYANLIDIYNAYPLDDGQMSPCPRRKVVQEGWSSPSTLEATTSRKSFVTLVQASTSCLRYYMRKFMEIHFCIQSCACRWKTRCCATQKESLKMFASELANHKSLQTSR